MPEQRASAPVSYRSGWVVTLSGMGIGLAIGVLYAWSVISKHITKEWGWTEMQAAMPYSLAIAVFAFTMVPAGRLQDRFGPRAAATLGGILCSAGFFISSISTELYSLTLGFGVLVGAGIGFGYASVTPPAVKWFPQTKTGLIAGIVVVGSGLAPVYIAPLVTSLFSRFGIATTFQILGATFLVVVTILAQFLRNPPAGYVAAAQPSNVDKDVIRQKSLVDFSWRQMLRTPQFYLLWTMYVFAAGAGLMTIGKLAKIVDLQAGIRAGFVFVALLAVGNAAGRVMAGFISDKIGRTFTLGAVFILQAGVMASFTYLNNFSSLLLVSILAGVFYGANLSVFPAMTKDFFGLKNFGVNYGLVFTAWGVGGVAGPMLSSWIFDSTQSFRLAYWASAVCLLLAFGLSFFTKVPEAPGA